MKHANKAILTLAVLVAAAGLVACGSSDEGTSGPEKEAVSGSFERLPGAPPGDRRLAGEATLERSDGGTTVALALTGLEPRTEYVAHLHSGSCRLADPGGPHFKFRPGGSDEPPNEIHLELTSKASGAGSASTFAKREVPLGEAGSVVLHRAEADRMTSTAVGEGKALLVHEGHRHEEPGQPEKVACAELEGAGSSDASQEESASRGGKVTTIVVRNGEPVGGIAELEYSAGEEIRFEVSSDVADEVHVHGYDLMQEVPAGGTVSFDFPAEIEGIFEVELEGRKEQIAELRVNP
jgi:plastocyanin